MEKVLHQLEIPPITEWIVRLDYPAAATQQVEDQHNHRNYEQQVNQTAADAAEHSKQPQDE